MSALEQMKEAHLELINKTIRKLEKYKQRQNQFVIERGLLIIVNKKQLLH